MRLRRKVLLSFGMLTVVNGTVALFVLEAAYLSRVDAPTARNLVAPGLGLVAASLALGGVFTAYLLYQTIQRLVLEPVEDMVSASHFLMAGESVPVRAAGRNDEMGRLAETFNTLAERVTESRANLEEKVREAAARVEETQRELAFTERLAATGRLAAGVAHEINNPLGGVMNAVARLRKGGLAPEREARYLDICEDGLRRIQETVRRILDFSRKRPERGPVAVAAPLSQSIDLVRHLLAPANIALKTDFGADGGASLSTIADAGDLQHVFLNLLVNAVDAMPEGGVLTVGAREEGSRVVVEIADTGVGLTEEEISASFDYFHTTKPVGKGTGLGLSIAHHIVEGCGGTLTLTSEKGAGTTATVSLPGLAPGPATEEGNS